MQLAAGSDGDRRGGRIEIAELGRAGKIRDAVGRDDVLERRGEIDPELVALGLQPACVVVPAQGHGGRHRAVVPLQAPEVVPVRVHGLGGIAFVADGRRKQPVERPVRGSQRGVGTLGLPQRLQIAHRRVDVRPHRFQEPTVSGVAVHFRDQEDELAGTVVFRHGVGTTLVDAAGNLAVGELMRGEPPQIVGRDVSVTRAQQRLRHHGAVPDPGARIGPRPRAEHRPVPRDQHVRLCGAEGGDQWPAGARDLDRHPAQSLTPPRSHACLLAVHPARRRFALEIGWDHRPRKRHDDAHGRPAAWRQREAVAERRRGIAELVADLRSARPAGRGDQARDRPGGERKGPDDIWPAQGEDPVVGVDGERRAVPGDVANRARAADRAEELRWGVHLERPHRQNELDW